MSNYNIRTFSNGPNKMRSADDYINRKKATTLYTVAASNTSSRAKNSNIPVKTTNLVGNPKLASVGGYNVNSYDLLMNISKGRYYVAPEGRYAELLNNPLFTTDISNNIKINDCSNTQINTKTTIQTPINQTWDLNEGSYLIDKYENISEWCKCTPNKLSKNKDLQIDSRLIYNNNALPQSSPSQIFFNGGARSVARWNNSDKLRGFSYPKIFCIPFSNINNNNNNNNNPLAPPNSDWSFMFLNGQINPNGANYQFFVDRNLQNNSLNQDLIDTLTPFTYIATNMEGMFQNANQFNSNLDSWNVSNVTNMKSMFQGATNFNQDIGNWNINLVTDITNMFTNTDMNTTYNTNSSRTVAGWFNNKNGGASGVPSTIFSAVTGWPGDLFTYSYVFLGENNLDLYFAGTTYSGPNGQYGNASAWNVSRYTSGNNVFLGNSTFNEDIGNWDVANFTNMNSMFVNASAFNKDLNNWDTSKVTSIANMFKGATSFNGNITNWNMSSNDGYLIRVFQNASSFNQDIGGWDISNCKSIQFMFDGASAFNQDISGWRFTTNTNILNKDSFNSVFNNANMSNQDWSGSGAGGTAWRDALDSVTGPTNLNSIGNFFTTGDNYWQGQAPPNAYPIINPP